MRSHAKAATAGSNQRQARGFAAALGAALLLALLTAPAASAVQQEKLFGFGPDGISASDFEWVGSVAVDQADGSVYVLDSPAGELFRFGPDGEPRDFAGTSPYIDGNRIDGLDLFNALDPAKRVASSQVAVDASTHAFYLTEKHAIRAFLANGEPAEFTAGPGAGTSEIPGVDGLGFGELLGVAVDASGNIYASDHTGTVSVFSPSGEALISFSVPGPHTLAVDSAGVAYVLSQLKEIKTFNPSEPPVSASTTFTEGTPIPKKFSSAVITGFNIDPLTGTAYLLESDFSKSWIRIIDKSGAELETIGEPKTPREGEALEGQAEGLAVLGTEIEVGPEERVKFFTGDTPETGESQAAAFGTKIIVGPPSFQSLRVTGLTADSALLRAFVTPNTKPTTYRFEYGLEDCSVSLCASVPVGGASIGEGSEPVAVAQTITGLAPGATYHYRIVAKNDLGEEEEEGTFATQLFGGSSELGDGRAWEMASPPDKGSATLASPALGLVQAAESGNGIAYLSRGSIEADPDGNRSFEVSSVLSERAPGGSWSSKDITPANARVVPLGVATRGEYMLFDSELATALIEPHDGTQLSPLASERTPYLRENTEPPAYTPLVTGKEGVANVPPGTVFGGNPLFSLGSVSVTGANASMSDVVLTSLVPLVEGASGQGLYHWRAGELEALSVLPEDEGGQFVPSDLLGSGAGSRRNAISEDGGRIFWTRSSPSALYLRDTEAEETVRLDVPSPDASGLGAVAPVFQGANPDGTVVFFKDTQQLTKDASPSGADLYRCEIEAEDSSGGCASLTDVTGATQSDGESAEVIGLLPGMSEDATSVYLVARGVLDTAPNGHGDSAAPGEPNLYLWTEGEGVRFIAALSEKDDPDWGLGETKLKEEVTNSSALASRGGRYLTFMSELSLTGQGNHDAETGNQAQQAFVYDADSDQLSCVSCSPLGAAPVAEVSRGAFFQLVDPQSQWEGRWVSAIVPQSSTIREGNGSLYRSRAMLDNGRAFFHSFDSLVPLDTNHQWDVYEFEPIGVGGCSASSGGKAITRSGGGCVSLVSSGTAEGEAAFLDASASGDDAFFLTPARLSVLDKDSVLDVYDARVDGVPATLEPSAECLGEACQPAAVVPNDPTPASAGFKGQGNQGPKARKRCAKGKRKVRRGGKARCVTRKHKRANQSRGAGR